ncbi:MAG: NADH-quinone oxidoreductase subunit C [Candidatus Stahlbacteria bacterium]|nr:NADH-quinone oxidoreductase subunit C [Candidatus Stahlbacteria bacterium]
MKEVQPQLEKLRSKFADAVEIGDTIYVTISSDKLYDCCEYLKELGYDLLQFLTAIDRLGGGTTPANPHLASQGEMLEKTNTLACTCSQEKIDLRYYFYSYTHKGKVVVKSSCDRKGGRVKSITGLYGTANWHEREVYDLFGIIFEGHPDMRRLLLEEDFVGHPLLKDYTGEGFVKFP